jgi:hypothetical protein
MFQSFGDHSIPFTGGDAVDLTSQLDTLGYTIHGDHAFRSIIKGSSDSRSRAENVNDHNDSVSYIV